MGEEAIKKNMLQTSLAFLNVFGLNPKRRNLFSLFRMVFGLLISFAILTLTLLESLWNWKGIDTLAAATEQFVALYQEYWKIGMLTANRKKILEAVDRVHVTLDLTQPQEHQKFIDDVYKRFYTVLNVLKLFFVISSVVFSLKPFFNYGVLPIVCYQPEFLRKWPGYEIASILCVTHTFMLMTCMFGFDCLLILFVTRSISELKKLEYEFEELALKGGFKERFKKLVEHHDDSLNFIGKLNEIFSLILLNQLGANMISLCVGLFIINVRMNGDDPDYQLVLRSGMYMLSFLCQLYIYSVAGAKLMTQSLSVSGAIYSASWWVDDVKNRKGAFLIIQRAQKEDRIILAGMINLDLETFANVLKTSFSYYSIMQALFAQDKAKRET